MGIEPMKSLRSISNLVLKDRARATAVRILAVHLATLGDAWQHYWQCYPA
jgi:hypothetical protein